jgi:hypothetical protein
MDGDPLPSDNPREWARPDLEGDPWHDYWEPDGTRTPQRQVLRDMRPVEAEQEREARRRLARKMAIAYLVVVPIAIAVNLIFSQFYRTPLSAVIGALVCTVGLIRILAYGERSLGLILAMVAFVLAWIVIVVVRIVQIQHASGMAFG